MRGTAARGMPPVDTAPYMGMFLEEKMARPEQFERPTLKFVV